MEAKGEIIVSRKSLSRKLPGAGATKVTHCPVWGQVLVVNLLVSTEKDRLPHGGPRYWGTNPKKIKVVLHICLANSEEHFELNQR